MKQYPRSTRCKLLSFFKTFALPTLFSVCAATVSAAAPVSQETPEAARPADPAAVFAATGNRGTLAAYCLTQLSGPDRLVLATELARRHARHGDIPAALALAENEDFRDEPRIRLLKAMAEYFQENGEFEKAAAAVDEVLPIYFDLHPWVQEQLKTEIADLLILTRRLPEAVAHANELGGWKGPYFLSLAAEAFPNWQPITLLDQSLALAQQQEPREKAHAYVRLSPAYLTHENQARANALLRAAAAEAANLQGREKVVALAALAAQHARRGEADRATAQASAACHYILTGMEGWEQSDALLDLSRHLAGTAAAPLGWPFLEKTSLKLSSTAEADSMRNKYRAYEFLGVVAAGSPAGAYSDEERQILSAELTRLSTLPDNTEVD